MTKRFFALILGLCLMFSLAACNSSETPSTGPSTGNTNTFEKPDNYSAVMLVSINPQVNLYLADDGIVLAVEAVNEDAAEIIADVKAENATYQAIIKKFISAANAKGFIQADAKLTIKVTEQKDDKLDSAELLENASQAAENAATELGVTLEVVAGNDNSGNGQDETHTHSYGDATCTEAAKCECGATTGDPLGHDWQAATCKAPKTCKTCGATEGDKAAHTYVNGVCSGCGITEAHTHSFSKATCTEAAKCACGETNGDPLGHDWQAATCKAPKTCKTCGATEGNKGDHNYVNGTCSVCGAVSILNPQTNLSDKEYLGNLNVSDDMLIGAALQFDGEACAVIERYFSSVQTDPDQVPVVFEGKNYYSEGGGMEPYNYELTETEILVKGCLWGDDPDTVTMKLVLQSNGMLKVTYSTNSKYPVGTILSTNINDVLR